MSLRDIFWSVCHAVSPDLHLTLKSTLGARRSRRAERLKGQIVYTEQFIHRFGPTVLSGPFKGLKFPAAAFGHHLVPKLMGVYELQLHEAVETAIARQPARVVDIGAAEGYYAAGFALRLPGARVHAFDAAPTERAISRQVAAENGLSSRVEVGGICTTAWLQANLRPGDFVFSDCEGGEDGLIDPANVPALRTCDLLVETHDHAAPGVTERLLARFRSTHEITCLRGVVPPRETLPVMEAWTPQDYDRVLDDGRVVGEHHVEQDWLLMLARDRQPSSGGPGQA